jgi:hypothetical protein
MEMNEETRRLEGRVAAILNARELVINIGSADGVLQTMKFAVLAETPLQVKDPDSGKVLDKIDREKVRVQAMEVREKITICRTYRVKKIGGGPWAGLSLLGELASPVREVPETLAIADSSMPPPLAEEESYVKIKDRVVQVTDA